MIVIAMYLQFMRCILFNNKVILVTLPANYELPGGIRTVNYSVFIYKFIKFIHSNLEVVSVELLI